MIFVVSRLVVLLLGAAICALSIWGLLKPKGLVMLVARVARSAWGLYFAIGVRVLLGGALLVIAETSRFPTAFRIIGWLALAAAIALVFMGRGGMERIVAWFSGVPRLAIRAWLLVGAMFGIFLSHGAS